MAIVVEDGTGKASAVSYISATDAAAYFEARGDDTFSDLETAEQESALVRATFALDSWLRGRWTGTKKTQEQSLAWPRSDAVDEEGFEISDASVPNPVKAATCEIALIEASGTPFLQRSVSASNAVSSESVGPISVSYRGDAPMVTTYPHIEAIISGLAAVGGAMVTMNVSLTQDEIDAQSESSSVFDYDEYFNIVKWG